MEEYFEYLDEIYDDEPNWFVGALKLCEKFGIPFNEAVDVIVRHYRGGKDE